MRASPWLPVLLILALAAYLLPEADVPFLPRVNVAPRVETQAPTPPVTLPEDARALFDKSRPATVRVESVNTERNRGGIGTGFFISAGGQLLTAYHVVSGGQVFQVSTLSGRSYGARVVAFDASADVALLQVNGRGTNFPYLNLTTRAPRPGETVLAIGNSGGDFLQPRRGRLLRLNAEAGRADFPQGTLEMTAPLAPGDSGGPIIDGNGQAIGVVSYISLDGSGQTRRSYAVPVVEGNDLISALRAGITNDVPVVGLVFDAIHSGQTDPPGAIVREVARRSPAEQAGLRGSTFDEQGSLTGLGDVILRVNGQRTRDANEVITAIRRAKVGDTVTLTYLRDDQERQARITLVPKASVPDLPE